MTSQRGYQTIAIHILPNVSQSKVNQTMKYGQLIEHDKYFSSKIIQKMRQGDLFQTSLYFFKKLNIR